MGRSSVASRRRAALQPHPGRGVGPPASRGESNPSTHIKMNQKCANCREKSPLGGSKSNGEALQSTAKRGWMKQCPRRIVRETEGAPMRRGPLGKTRRAPMRQGPLDITAVLFGDVRAGRAAARSVVPKLSDSSSAGSVPTAQELLRLPGTDGKHSCGTWSRSGESQDLPLRLFLALRRWTTQRSFLAFALSAGPFCAPWALPARR